MTVLDRSIYSFRRKCRSFDDDETIDIYIYLHAKNRTKNENAKHPETPIPPTIRRRRFFLWVGEATCPPCLHLHHGGWHHLHGLFHHFAIPFSFIPIQIKDKGTSKIAVYQHITIQANDWIPFFRGWHDEWWWRR